MKNPYKPFPLSLRNNKLFSSLNPCFAAVSPPINPLAFCPYPLHPGLPVRNISPLTNMKTE